MKEGIIIVDKPHGYHTFFNKAAKRFLGTLKEAFSPSRGVFSTDAKIDFDKSFKYFSKLDMSLFNCGEDLLDRDKVVKCIQEKSNYMSLDEIIAQQTEIEDSHFKQRKQLYKVVHKER